MKVAFLAESPADRAAYRILTEAVLGKTTEEISHKGLEHRGWPAVRTVLPAVLKELHYRSDAEGFVLVVDSNGDPPHLPAHDPPSTPEPGCHLCQLRKVANEALSQVRPRTNLLPLKLALGLAVPTIEAWLLCGVDSHVTEAAWINGLKDERGRMQYTKKSLKQQLYGTSHPSLSLSTEAMRRAAKRVAQDMSALEKLFPYGFGALASSLRSW